MDFSTTKEDPEPMAKEVLPAQTSFTSSRELKFAKNLKILLVEILRYGFLIFTVVDFDCEHKYDIDN